MTSSSVIFHQRILKTIWKFHCALLQHVHKTFNRQPKHKTRNLNRSERIVNFQLSPSVQIFPGKAPSWPPPPPRGVKTKQSDDFSKQLFTLFLGGKARGPVFDDGDSDSVFVEWNFLSQQNYSTLLTVGFFVEFCYFGWVFCVMEIFFPGTEFGVTLSAWVVWHGADGKKILCLKKVITTGKIWSNHELWCLEIYKK